MNIIPCLVVLTPSCDVLTSQGVEEVGGVSDEALRLWTQGKRLFWTRPPTDGEHVWQGVSCALCHMNPIVGIRRSCSHRGCDIDLCDTCTSKNTHEHPLVEHLIPQKQHSLEQIFASIPYLLDPNNGKQIETKTLWEDDAKSIGIYFSADQCPPDRDITSKLAQYYTESKASEHPFRLVFVSNDENEPDFDKYRVKMPWPAVPFNAEAALKNYFEYPGQ